MVSTVSCSMETLTAAVYSKQGPLDIYSSENGSVHKKWREKWEENANGLLIMHQGSI